MLCFRNSAKATRGLALVIFPRSGQDLSCLDGCLHRRIKCSIIQEFCSGQRSQRWEHLYQDSQTFVKQLDSQKSHQSLSLQDRFFGYVSKQALLTIFQGHFSDQRDFFLHQFLSKFLQTETWFGLTKLETTCKQNRIYHHGTWIIESLSFFEIYRKISETSNTSTIITLRLRTAVSPILIPFRVARIWHFWRKSLFFAIPESPSNSLGCAVNSVVSFERIVAENDCGQQ